MKFVFKNRYGELRSGWAITAALLIMVIAQLTARPLSETGDETNPAFKLAVTLVYGIISIGGILLLFKLLYKRSFKQLGFISEKGIRTFFFGLAFGAVSMGMLFILLIVTGQVKIIAFDKIKLFSLGTIAEFISVCVFMFSEELLARGFFMTAIKTTRIKGVILFVPALIFALLHFMNPDITLLAFINIFIAGLLWGCMFMKCGSLWLSTGFHVAWNFLNGDMFGMKTSGTEQPSVLITEMGNNSLLTGLPNGPAGSIFTTCIFLVAVFIVCYRLKKPDYPVWTIDSDLPLTRDSVKVGENRN
jgi:membrane protease YdiL (CAAX protease family)